MRRRLLALVAWWRTRRLRQADTAIVGVLLAIALMVMLGYAVWWTTTQSAIAAYS